MTFFEAYDVILAAGAHPAHAERVAEMRRAFEKRTGELSAQSAPAYSHARDWSDGLEARMRAFWDDALTTQGFALEIEAELPEEARAWTSALARAHRGLFVLLGDGPAVTGGPLVRDLWSGAEFVVHAIDEATRLALAAVSAPFDARLVGRDDPPRVAMMPGAVFHPADAATSITKVLEQARAARRRTGDVLDALLRMEKQLRASARVKAAYAYRIDKL